MLVFRDGGRQVALRPLLEQLVESCRRVLVRADDKPAALAALLRAGELECALNDCALEDCASPSAAVARVTDALADALLGIPLDAVTVAALDALQAPALQIQALPESALLSVPEGFAYYALHPMDYADAVYADAVYADAVYADSVDSDALARLPLAARAVVVGIRSIGTTLSAVTRAALARRGVSTTRITVRPTGHPWDRETRFSAEQERLISVQNHLGADFLVVDEGPGLSGSSFLSVAEALAGAGVPHERITLLGSHAADPARMRARDAVARWSRFRYVSVAPPTRLPPQRDVDLSGGEWRRELLPADAEWPASWTAFERRKFLSSLGTHDGTQLLKFDGLGHYGDAVRDRSRELAELGFSPPVSDAGDGFSAYRFVAGTPMRAADATGEVLRRIAAYCAARAQHIRVPAAETVALKQLVAVNWRAAFGHEMAPPELTVERPVIADARMQPQEWVRGADGTIWKTDAAGHGDDHFFPGPTDIAWDLAGTVIEWDLDADRTAFLLAEYRRLTADDAETRLPGYLLAYALFRLGYSEMAADAMRGSEEEMRLRRDAERYRSRARALREFSAVA